VSFRQNTFNSDKPQKESVVRKTKLSDFLIVAFCLCVPCSNVYALPLFGSAHSDITNLNINFSDINAVSIARKGMYPANLNGTHCESYANDRASGITQTQTVDNGPTMSNAGHAHSFAGNSYVDIAQTPLSNNIYDGVTYSSSADGLTDTGTDIRSYAVINDDWLFTATAPVSVTISFDYTLSASGETTNSLGTLITEAVVGLGLGVNDTTWYDPGNYTDGGLVTGTISMNMKYLSGDRGNISIWHGADVLSDQSQPAPVPEPATMFLFGTGLVGLVGSRFRKKK
jgi:hypothetical protein